MTHVVEGARTRPSIFALASASLNVAVYRLTSNGVPFVGEQNRRSSSPTNAVRDRWSSSERDHDRDDERDGVDELARDLGHLRSEGPGKIVAVAAAQ
jgi:hypothetical protein